MMISFNKRSINVFIIIIYSREKEINMKKKMDVYLFAFRNEDYLFDLTTSTS